MVNAQFLTLLFDFCSVFSRLAALVCITSFTSRKKSSTFSTNNNTWALVQLGRGGSMSFPMPVPKAGVPGFGVPRGPEHLGKGRMKGGSCNQEKGMLCGPNNSAPCGLEPSSWRLLSSQAHTPPSSSRPFPFCFLSHMSSAWKAASCLACLAFMGGTRAVISFLKA